MSKHRSDDIRFIGSFTYCFVLIQKPLDLLTVFAAIKKSSKICFRWLLCDSICITFAQFWVVKKLRSRKKKKGKRWRNPPNIREEKIRSSNKVQEVLVSSKPRIEHRSKRDIAKIKRVGTLEVFVDSRNTQKKSRIS